MKKIGILLIILIFALQQSHAQYKALEINLEIHTLKKGKECTRYSLFQNDSISFLTIKDNPVFDYTDPKTWQKRDADTALIIESDAFNEIAEMSINLSSSDIIKGANLSDIIISYDGISVNLELVSNQNRICYNISNPMSNTKERNLEPFLAVCKEILLLAKLKPRKYLR